MRERARADGLSRLAPSVTRVVTFVSRAFCSTDYAKRGAARGLRLRANGRNNPQHCCANNVGSCWPTMLRPFARGLTHRDKAK